MKPRLIVCIIFILTRFTLIAQSNSLKVTYDKIIKKLPTKEGDNFTTVFKDTDGNVVIHLYKPDKVDLQPPHPQDEFYMIASGYGKYIIKSDTLTIKKGDLVFAPKGVKHKFYDFSKNFSAWVIFYGENLTYKMDKKAYNRTLVDDFLETWERTKKYTISIVEAMPEKSFNTRGKDSRSFAEEVLHIIDNLYFLRSNYILETGVSFKDLKYANKEDLISKLETAFNNFGNAVSSLNLADLEKRVKFFNGKEYSKQQILYLAKDHTAHHRSKMILILREKGVEAPKYIGW